MSPAPVLRRPPIRSAARGLELICDGLGRALLIELATHGPLTRSALAARLHAGPTRVYECLKVLRGAELIEITSAGRASSHSITGSGRALLEVASMVEAWSRMHPGGALEPSVGWRAFEDVGEAWRTGLLEWIVRLGPPESEAARGLPGLPGRRLTERLSALGEAGMVTRRRGADGRLHYRLSPWAARVIGPLSAIAGWEERFHPPGAAPITVEDGVLAILATLPLVRLGPDCVAICTLTVEGSAGAPGLPRTGTAWARLRGGRAQAIGEGAPPRPADAWAAGSLEAWLAAVLGGRPRALRAGGREPGATALVERLVDQLHTQLLARAS